MNILKNIVLATLFTLLTAFAANAQPADFMKVVQAKFDNINVVRNGKYTKGIDLAEVCDTVNKPVERRVFREYGAMYVAEGVVTAPFRCVLNNEAEVQSFQKFARFKTQNVGGTTITLQENAMNALLEAVKEAAGKRLRISPRGGPLAAQRSYQDTVGLWKSRFLPGLAYWTNRGRISRTDADAVRSWNITEQVEKVLEWEDQRMWFSKELSKSILYSVAAPGASQHIFMVALDVEQFASKAVREILANHGWFQTVKSDAPHFTYLGVKRDQLEALGLKKEPVNGQEFWIPNISR